MSITRVTAQNAELYRQAEIKKIDRRQAELLQEEQRVHEQLAANEKGVQELRKMVEQFSLSTVLAYMDHVQDNAEESVRRVITRLKNGEFNLPLDNGAQIKVAIRVDTESRSAEIDFTGTSAQQTNNFKIG